MRHEAARVVDRRQRLVVALQTCHYRRHHMAGAAERDLLRAFQHVQRRQAVGGDGQQNRRGGIGRRETAADKRPQEQNRRDAANHDRQDGDPVDPVGSGWADKQWTRGVQACPRTRAVCARCAAGANPRRYLPAASPLTYAASALMSSSLSDLTVGGCLALPLILAATLRSDIVWMFASPTNEGTFIALPIVVSARPLSPWAVAPWALAPPRVSSQRRVACLHGIGRTVPYRARLGRPPTRPKGCTARERRLRLVP